MDTLTINQVLAAVKQASNKNNWEAKQVPPDETHLRGAPVAEFRNNDHNISQEQLVVYEVSRIRSLTRGTDHMVVTCAPGLVIFGWAGERDRDGGGLDAPIPNDQLLTTLKSVVFGSKVE